jgi:hypothetical protein
MTETQNTVTELTPEDVKLILNSNHKDVRNSYSEEELVGIDVVAIFWNGRMDGYSFKVIKLDEGGVGNADDDYVYNLELAYMIIFKVDFIALKYKGLLDYQKKLTEFQNSYNQLVGSFNDMDGFEKDLVNENSQKYPFTQSLEDINVKDWVDSLLNLKL